ncbi:MAG: class I SAM-dependent methyltransferase, partial [Planctomycetes bacterium]|nr:class I SAM-dependent methyltransferase [Planctomycetota bacterium]
CTLVAYEPYPNQVLQKGFSGLDKLETQKAQDIELQELEKLGSGDILFIDSSHVAKLGSDVLYELLEMIPRLKKGVIVHIHDIYFPHVYPKELAHRDHMFWNEQYLLQSFLAFNSSFEVLWSGSYMHQKAPEKLREAFESYKETPSLPASFWMRRVED